jgi:hypothetical protein
VVKSESGRSEGGRCRSGRSRGMHRRRRHALEASECVGQSTEVDGADETDRDGGEDKVSEAVKQSELVRTR